MKFANSLETHRCWRSKGPILLVVLLILIVLLFVFLWKTGGEVAQKPVEKVIPAERLGK